MALTEKNQLLIAFKKLYGKSHTSAKFGIFNESIGSSVQLGINTIFGNQIPTIPSSSLYDITNNVVEKVKFDLVPIPLSTYASTLGSLAGTTIDDEGDTSVNGVHAYRLVLPSNYQSNSNNPKKGTGFYLDSATASVSYGALQLIPPSFGDLYSAEVSSSSGIIGGLDNEDYYLDYYSGILFIQDIGRTPTAVSAYLYVGDYGAVSASYAETASVASQLSQDIKNDIKQAYGNLRYVNTGSFDVNGYTSFFLPLTSSAGADRFPTSSLDYLNIGIQIKTGSFWANDLVAIYSSISGNIDTGLDQILVEIDASDAPLTQFKCIVINESIDNYSI